MSARLQADVQRTLGQQALIGPADGGKGVDLGMGLAAAGMVALADDSAVTNNDSANHRIGRCPYLAIEGKLQAAGHVCYFTI